MEIRGAQQEGTAEKRKVAAVHEAGHALLQTLEQPGTLQYASIRQRPGEAGHIAVELPNDNVTEEWVRVQIRQSLAGRAAEEVLLGRVTGGAGGPANSDLARATRLALNTETASGLSERPLLWLGLWGSADLATLLLTQPNLARRVEARLQGAYSEACELIRQHRPTLEVLAARLLEREVMTGNEVAAVLEGSLP